MAETMNGMKRTHYCGTLRMDHVGQEVIVCGWVQRQRDLGQLIFIDLRDRTGIVQLAFDESTDRDIFQKAFTIRGEFVLAARGKVRERTSKNMEIPTGEIEIEVTELRVLAKSETPPFEILEDSNVKEDTRLKYRYLDLRRPNLQRNLIARHKLVKVAHDYFDRNGFLEIETPDLIASTPEGARDFLVPSRVFQGSFFALPQSPQLYKQLLMLSGFDRYMQVARCFRDEDLRADRQPEFTQIDFEMSFVDQEDVMAIGEGFIREAYKELCVIDIPLPLPRLTWDEAMRRFGSDKPDMRFGLELVDLSDLLRNTEFKVFSGALAEGAPCAASASRARPRSSPARRSTSCRSGSRPTARRALPGRASRRRRPPPTKNSSRRRNPPRSAPPWARSRATCSSSSRAGTTPWCSPLSARCAASWPGASA